VVVTQENEGEVVSAKRIKISTGDKNVLNRDSRPSKISPSEE
jgi:hypothetical protein